MSRRRKRVKKCPRCNGNKQLCLNCGLSSECRCEPPALVPCPHCETKA